MKKLTAVLLALTLLVPAAWPVMADGDSAQMEQVLRSVKERIGATDAFETFESRIVNYDGRTRYAFDWSTDGDDTYKYMSVEAYPSGIITNYYYYDDSSRSYDERASINKPSSAEILPHAQELVNQLNPQLAGELRVFSNSAAESLYEKEFSFGVARYYNGLPVYGNTGYVRLDAAGERILNFSIDYSEDLEFETAEGAVTPQQAQQAFAEQLGMELVYRMEYDGKTRSVYAAYVPKDHPYTYIHALTGEAVTVLPDDYVSIAKSGSGGGSLEQAADATANSSRLTAVEINELESIAGLQPMESLRQKLSENGVVEIPDTMELTRYSFSKDPYEEKYYYNFTFNSKEGEPYRHVSATMDAATGEIYSLYTNESGEGENAGLSKEQMKAIADEAASALTGEKFEEYEYRTGDEDPYFCYVRKVNGIPFMDDTIDVHIDAATGAVCSYSRSYSQVDFPALDAAIGLDAAMEKLFEQVGYSVCYMPTRSSESVKLADRAIPVYMLDDTKTGKIDAFTGALLGYDSKPYVDETPVEYTDIAGHYAEAQIKKLAQYGIRFDGTQFKPDEQIMQKDYIALLVATLARYNMPVIASESDGSETYQIAKNNGIITDEEINPEQIVTREWAAEFIIRAMGIAEYANLSGIYIPQFTDVSEHVGAISILSAMGVVNGDGNGLFNPKGALTRADAAILIYNYLSR